MSNRSKELANFYDLVGAPERRQRDGETKRLGRLSVISSWGAGLDELAHDLRDHNGNLADGSTGLAGPMGVGKLVKRIGHGELCRHLAFGDPLNQ